MPSAADRIDFGPPRNAGAVRAFGLALIAHGLLIAALTWGVNWKTTDRSVSFEAEIWSAVPQEAAPKLIEQPPPPPPEPAKVAEAKPAPVTPDVDIALEQEKKRKLLKQQQDAEALAKKQKEQKVKDDQAKRLAAQQEAKRLEAQKQPPAKQPDTSQATLNKQRQDALNRMMGLAGASGSDDAKGSALKSSGPSASYGGKVRAKVKPNIVFTDDIVGNPVAEVEVRSSPTGAILSQRLVKSSGNKAWDDAVVKAIIRTETMPKDVDGRVPSPMILELRPRD